MAHAGVDKRPLPISCQLLETNKHKLTKRLRLDTRWDVHRESARQFSFWRISFACTRTNTRMESAASTRAREERMNAR
jgi:hypothetical protein